MGLNGAEQMGAADFTCIRLATPLCLNSTVVLEVFSRQANRCALNRSSDNLYAGNALRKEPRRNRRSSGSSYAVMPLRALNH